jgi:hypothetical protein
VSSGDDRPLPDVPDDETDRAWGERVEDAEDDVRRLLEERPPHHTDRDRD